jgi:hypothetical protein
VSDWESVIDLIGLRAAEKLCQAFGPRRIYIAKKPTSMLIDVIGERLAHRLCEVWGGDRLELRSMHQQGARMRAQQIFAMRAAGHTANAIARHLGVTPRRVFQVLSARTKKSCHAAVG